EMMMALEETFQTTLDESAVTGTRTIRELEEMVGMVLGSEGPRVPGFGPGGPRSGPRVSGSDPRVHESAEARAIIEFPTWKQSRLATFVRRISLPTWILPLGRPFMKMTVQGLEHLAPLDGPVIFAANHQSHMDTPAILLALPARWRYHVAPAMAKEF